MYTIKLQQQVYKFPGSLILLSIRCDEVSRFHLHFSSIALYRTEFSSSFVSTGGTLRDGTFHHSRSRDVHKLVFRLLGDSLYNMLPKNLGSKDFNRCIEPVKWEKLGVIGIDILPVLL